jgi:endonuclease/exonuclease/phosphatase family metal-dependent hydrolase
MTPRLRVATWNVREGVPVGNNDSSYRDDLVETTLLQAHVQVAALQEVPFTEDDISVLDVVGKRIGLSHSAFFPMSPSTYRKDHETGVAVLASRPLRNVARHVLPNPELRYDSNGETLRSYDKGVLSTSIVWNGQPVVIITLHTFPFHAFDRRAEDPAFEFIWESLASTIDEYADDRLIVCGDFNTSRRHLLMTKLLRAELVRAIGEKETAPGASADDILYSKHFTLLDSQVRRTFSDHGLCIAELQLDS